jgi:hypothetical protein
MDESIYNLMKRDTLSNGKIIVRSFPGQIEVGPRQNKKLI